MNRRTKRAAPLVAGLGLLVAARADAAFDGVDRFGALDRLPEIDPSVHVAGSSSHARDGTNGDSYLYVEGEPDHRPYLYRDGAGRFVLMEAAGPGAITRIWMTEIAATSGDTAAAGNLQIFFDGEAAPRVDLPAPALFSGTVPPFLAPLCGDYRVSSGGDYCYVTMPFRNGVKVAVTGRPNYWNVGYETYPPDAPVATFDPAAPATLGMAESAASTLSRAGTNPEILPPGDVHTGTATIDAGSAEDLVTITAAGTLRAVEIALDPADDRSLQNTWLEIRWDGSGRAEIDAPLADVFLTGAGERSPALGLLAGYHPDLHSGYLYFPMPFASGAAARLVNRGSETVTATWRIEESPERYSEIGKSVGELRATFHSEPSTRTGTDYSLLETGGAGKIVGVSFTEEGPLNDSLLLFMEGDERVYFDGARGPQIYGTGTEDFFNGGFYYASGPFTLPTHGATAKETAPSGGRTSQYRLLLGDGWTFRRGIDFGIEHGGGDGTTSSARSVVFWYGIDRPQMRKTDAIDVGHRGSEARHDYRSDGDPSCLTAFYEGDHDGNLSPPIDFPVGSLPPLPGTDPMGESVTDDGRLHPIGSKIRFRVAIDPQNAGVVLRRRLDQAFFGQKAQVYVDGALAGTWLDPGMNGSKRWADSDFTIPRALSEGKRTLRIELDVLLPVEVPFVSFSIPSDPLELTPPSLNFRSPIGWTDFRYDVFAVSDSE